MHLLFQALPTLSAVTDAGDDEDFSPMGQAIQIRGSQQGAPKEFRPFCWGAIAGEQNAAYLNTLQELNIVIPVDQCEEIDGVEGKSDA